MQSVSRILGPVVATLALLSACSSSDDDTPGVIDIPAFAAARCNYFQRCGLGILPAEFGDAATCVTKLSTALKEQISLKGITLTQSQAAACEAKIDAQACDDDGTPSECVFKGTLPDNTGCGSSLQCMSGNCFFDETNGTVTTCGVCKPYAAEGGDCSATSCSPGLVCTPQFKCITGAPVGATCATAYDCAGYLQCVAGKCAPLLAAGAACDLTAQTTGICDVNKGLTCLPTNGDVTKATCQMPIYANTGGKCGVDATALTLSVCKNSACSDLRNGGTCLAFIPEGGACSTTSGGACDFDLSCVSGTCQRPALATCTP